ncbi:MAG: GAF domain-containing protein, partial [Terriglobales bacterium]
MATQSTESGKQPRTRAAAGDDLAIIAQRAQAFTNASGVAIALAEGDSTDEIVCRARSGASAPDVGAALRVQGTFTGLCIQTGKELRCDDAETDTRVDMTAIRALGIRSMVVTPIREDNKVIGVLAVFAPSAHAFTITHVAVLKTMADQISAAVLKERRARENGASAEPAPQYAPVAMAKPAVSVPAAP